MKIESVLDLTDEEMMTILKIVVESQSRAITPPDSSVKRTRVVLTLSTTIVAK
ncbi:MAG: hypothetical protein PHF63_00595 [Herbinix sp.]|nr:hypothetical protein [Herbinix sp.]